MQVTQGEDFYFFDVLPKCHWVHNQRNSPRSAGRNREETETIPARMANSTAPILTSVSRLVIRCSWSLIVEAIDSSNWVWYLFSVLACSIWLVSLSKTSFTCFRSIAYSPTASAFARIRFIQPCRNFTCVLSRLTMSLCHRIRSIVTAWSSRHESESNAAFVAARVSGPILPSSLSSPPMRFSARWSCFPAPPVPQFIAASNTRKSTGSGIWSHLHASQYNFWYILNACDTFSPSTRSGRPGITARARASVPDVTPRFVRPPLSSGSSTSPPSCFNTIFATS